MSASKQSVRRRRAVRATAPAVGLLAAGLLVWQGSYAAFSATTDNGTSSWATGTLNLLNNGGNAGAASYLASTTAIFGGTTLKPGATNTVCLTVKSGGTIAGALKMYATGITDTTTSGHDLSDNIKLTVDAGTVASDVTTNCTGFPTTPTNLASNVSLTSFANSYATATSVAVASGPVLVAYRVSWTFQSTGTNSTDNLLQGKTASAKFNWEIQ